MYRVIGLDQKEYGPIDAAMLGQRLSQGRVHGQSMVRREGDSQWLPITSIPELAPLAPPPRLVTPSQPQDAFATIVPYKNVPALAAYYLGVFSLIPVIGIFLGFAALWCGIVGLRRAKEYPEARGRVHAWIGIIVGGFFGVLYLGLIVLAVIAASSAH